MNIDWNATGSMIAGIGTWVAAILAAIVAYVLHKQTVKINEEGNRKMESEIKISLYDKRYVIYQCFSKYYNSFLIHEELPINLDRKEKDWAIIRGRIFQKIVDLEWMENLKNIILQSDSDHKQKELVNMYFCDVRQILMDMETIYMSKFCFPDEVSDSIVKWIRSFHDVIFMGSDQSNVEDNYKLLLDTTGVILDNDIISKMEKSLKISYSELYE